MELIQVYASSSTSAVAGAITGVILEYHQAEVQAIGAEAVSQAIQALALASCNLQSNGIFITCVPELAKVVIDNKARTAIKLAVRAVSSPSFASMGFSANPVGV